MNARALIVCICLSPAAFLPVSCGKKTAPVPPQTVIPAPVTDLDYQLDDNGVTLSWTKPGLTETGRKLPRIAEFIVERAEYPSDKVCRDCPLSYEFLASVDTPEGITHLENLDFRDENLKPDFFYSYRILSSLGWQVISRPSLPISFTWQIPVKAPSNLEAETGDRQIKLTWQAPADDLDNQPITGNLHYRVFRSIGGQDFMPLNEPVETLYFIDSDLTNGVGYRYKVRAARTTGGSGAFSNIVAAVPRDLTAPATPKGFEGIITPEGPRLFWDEVDAADLAGYLVFRHHKADFASGNAKIIAEIEEPITTFVDTSPIVSEGIWYYAVKSFDKARPPNRSDFSRIIEINKKR